MSPRWSAWSIRHCSPCSAILGGDPGRTRLVDPVDGEPRRVTVTDCRLKPETAQRKPMQAGHVRPYQPVFDAMLRVHGIRLEDLATA